MSTKGAFHKHGDPGADSRWRDNVALGQRVSAQARKCPQCGRRAAMRRIYYPGGVVRVCRWCGFETGFLL